MGPHFAHACYTLQDSSSFSSLVYWRRRANPMAFLVSLSPPLLSSLLPTCLCYSKILCQSSFLSNLMMQSTETVWSFANMGPLHIQDAQHKRRLCPSMDEEEDMVEEGCQYHVGEKKRRLTSEQVKFLEQSFEMENNLEPERKLLIAKHLKLQPRQVAVWFQNRRARWKTKQLEHNFDVLKASYDAILKDNEKLQAEVNALNALLNGSNIKKSSSVQDTISSVLPAINTHPSSHPQAAEKSEDISSKIEVDSPTKSEQSEVADSSCDVSASEPSALRLIEDSNSAFYSEGLLENLYNPGLLPQVAVKVEENLFQEDNCERLFSWEEPGLFFWCD